MRPQEIMLCLLKLLSEKRVSGLTRVGLSEIKKVSAPLGMSVTEKTCGNLLRCVPSIFTPQGILRNKPWTTPENEPILRSLKLFKMPRNMFLRNKIVGMVDMLCILLQRLTEVKGEVYSSPAPESTPLDCSSATSAYAEMNQLMQQLCFPKLQEITRNFFSSCNTSKETHEAKDSIQMLGKSHNVE